MTPRKIAVGTALALAGMVAAVAIGLLANTISGDSVGLSAAPLSAGDTLAPPASERRRAAERRALAQRREEAQRQRAAARRRRARRERVAASGTPADQPASGTPQAPQVDDHGGGDDSHGGGGSDGSGSSGTGSSGSGSSGSGSGDSSGHGSGGDGFDD
jgi:membrane protein involved in colicin uptake